MDVVINMVVATIAMFGSPGPATLSLAAAGAAFGFRHGANYLLGIVVGTLIDACLVVSGIASLMFFVPGVKPLLLVAAGAYILYLAYRIATAPPLQDTQHVGHAPTMLNGILLALSNPKAYAALAAVFSAHTLIPVNALADAVGKITILGIIILVLDCGWLYLGATISGHLKNPKISRALNMFFAFALIVSVGWAALVTVETY